MTSRSDLVSQGLVPDSGGPRWHDAIATASHQAFLSGLHVALLVAAAATTIGTVCGLFVDAKVTEGDDNVKPIHF